MMRAEPVGDVRSGGLLSSDAAGSGKGSRLERIKTDTNTNTDTNTYTNTDTNTFTNTDTNTYTNTGTFTYTNTETNSDTNTVKEADWEESKLEEFGTCTCAKNTLSKNSLWKLVKAKEAEWEKSKLENKCFDFLRSI